jgi:N-carbamoylputrescine amidase
MHVTVCEMPNEPSRFAVQWDALAEHAREARSELVLLPEMPFSRWLAATPDANDADWRAAMEAHDAWMGRLHELGAERVLGSRPIVDDGTRYNEGFVWTRANGAARPAHRKRYLPEEPLFWEASWYTRGPGMFQAVDAEGLRIGFAICTDMWFTAHARGYLRQRAQVIATPRATVLETTDKWIAGARAAAVVSGTYQLSSNFNGPLGSEGTFGGTGWIIEPEEGAVLGTTSSEAPFLTLDIDLSRVDAARETYPRTVLD